MLDRLHARVTCSPLLQRFTAVTRVLLALGFIPPGLTKVLGHPFTSLGVDHPVGYFFDAFFQASAFYAFIGWAQVIAAVLLLVPRTATLGAVLYFPIILNIFVVTVSIGFQGTWAITGLMLLASTYLLCWDYDRFTALLPVRRPRTERFGPREYVVQAAAGAVAGVLGFGVLLLGNLGNAQARPLPFFVIALGGGTVVGLTAAWHLRRMPTPEA